MQQEVSADSKEAKTFFKSQNKDEQEKDDEVETSSTSQTPCPGPRYTNKFTSNIDFGIEIKDKVRLIYVNGK